jgi:anti-sigma B factor antagonist
VSDSGGSHDEAVAGVEQRGNAVLVRLAGELDLYNAHVVRDALLGATGRSPERLIVDLSEVLFVDSTVLGVLIESRSKLANRRGFLLVAPGVETRRALEISGLDKHFAVHASLDEALTASL